MISQLHESPFKLNRSKLKASRMILTSAAKLAPALRHILEKITILLIPLPIFMLITGIEGIIEQESPDNLASLGTVGSGFFNFLEMHSLIIAGAFGMTFIIWFLTRSIWDNDEDCGSEYMDEYEEFVDEELVNHKHNSSHCP